VGIGSSSSTATASGSAAGSESTLRIYFDSTGAKAALNGQSLTSGSATTLQPASKLANGNGG